MAIETLYFSDFSDYLGSKELGAQAREEIALLWNDSQHIICNFNDVHGITGAFADEAFGKMFTEKGSQEYVDKVRFHDQNPLVKTIIKCTLYQRYERMQSGGWRL